VRASLYRLGTVLLSVAAPMETGCAQTLLHLPPADRVRLAEGRQLATRVCDRIWPGWGQTKFQVLLVGDSVGMVLYGLDDTLPVTLEMMIAHGAAVVRGDEADAVVRSVLAALNRQLAG